MELFIGTTNPSKLDHYRKFLAGSGIKILTPTDLHISEQPEETGETVEENAALKARFYFKRTHIPTLADDAGFEIPALGNWPGTHAHRINGHAASDQEIIDTIIGRMGDLKGGGRKARMHVVLALALSQHDIKTAGGEISGMVPEMPYDKLMPHFPYRSLLFITSLNKWFYDLTEDEESRIGYRRAALENIKRFLSS